MNYAEIIGSQYQACLEMLKQCIGKCPESMWDSAEDRSKFWHVAYHALFYTHLYLQDSEHDFQPWSRHRPEYQFIGQLPWPPHAPPDNGEPYDKDSILDYLGFCQQEVGARVPQLNLLELQFYNIRHLQQHTGELMERLGARADVRIDWVVMKCP
jgi:hypothetical protein